MMPCFTWRQTEGTDNPFVENRQFSAHPALDGILFTTRSNLVDKGGTMFNNTQTHIFLEIEQILTLTNFLLLYIKEVNDAKSKNELG